MKGQELFYPEVEARIGDYIFSAGIALDIYSDKKSLYDWAKVRFTKEFQDKVNLSAMDKAEILLGYDGVLQPVFSGYVTKSYNNASSADEIILKDQMLKLGGVSVTNTFIDVLPQEIATYALNKAGVTNMKLAETTYPAKPRVSVGKKSVPEVLKLIQDLWSTGDMTACIRDGVFYWGVTPPQENTYQFVYGENIISISRESGFWILETISMPFIRHSDIIQVTHPKISGAFEVQQMMFSTNQNGFIRTRICFM